MDRDAASIRVLTRAITRSKATACSLGPPPERRTGPGRMTASVAGGSGAVSALTGAVVATFVSSDVSAGGASDEVAGAADAAGVETCL